MLCLSGCSDVTNDCYIKIYQCKGSVSCDIGTCFRCHNDAIAVKLLSSMAPLI